MNSKLKITPIETYYNGCHFRSRLEARWAVYFDLCGIDWEYETEGYEITLENGHTVKYLPDFVLHNIIINTEYIIPNLYVEVKGLMTEYDELKIDSFHKSGHEILILQELPKKFSIKDEGFASMGLWRGYDDFVIEPYILVGHELLSTESLLSVSDEYDGSQLQYILDGGIESKLAVVSELFINLLNTARQERFEYNTVYTCEIPKELFKYIITIDKPSVEDYMVYGKFQYECFHNLVSDKIMFNLKPGYYFKYLPAVIAPPAYSAYGIFSSENKLVHVLYIGGDSEELKEDGKHLIGWLKSSNNNNIYMEIIEREKENGKK